MNEVEKAKHGIRQRVASIIEIDNELSLLRHMHEKNKEKIKDLKQKMGFLFTSVIVLIIAQLIMIVYICLNASLKP